MEKKQLNLWQKIAFGMGDFGGNFLAIFIGGFVMVYMTNTIGLNAGIIGMLMFAGRIFDGITDVVCGNLIDHTHTRYGKARPWMFVSAILCTLGIVAIFSTPHMSSTAQYVYFFVIYVLTNAFFYTANNISYCTLSALVTKNGDERVQLGMVRQAFATLAIMLIYGMSMSMVEQFGGGTKGWKTVALLFAVVFLMANLICVFSLKELPEEAGSKGRKENKKEISLIETLKILVKSKEFLSVLGVYLSFYLFTGVMGAVGVYYTMYVLGSTGYMGILSMAQNIPMIIAMAVVPIMLSKWGVYKTVNRSLSMAILGGIAFCIAAFMGNIWMLVGAMIFFCFFAAPMVGSLTGTVGEIGTFVYLQKGVHIEGSLFSCSSIGIKVGSGLGSAIVGWALALAGFDGLAAVQNASTIFTLKLIYGGIGLLCFVLCFLCFRALDMKTKIARLKIEKDFAIDKD